MDFDPSDPNQLLKAFNPLPSEEVQKKIDFFFMPYAPQRNNLKHMKFAEKGAKGLPEISTDLIK
jgi:hypothetical protein